MKQVQLRRLSEGVFRVVRTREATWPKVNDLIKGKEIHDLTDAGYLVFFAEPRNQGGIRPLDKGEP